ncbi:acyltransferase family protein [Pseudomonas palleroniana]
MQFYAIFPLLFLAFGRAGIVKTSLLIGWGVFMLGKWVSSHVNYIEPSLIVLRLNYFLAGMVLFSAIELGVSNVRRACLVACTFLLVYIGSRVEADPLVLPCITLLMLAMGLAEISGRAPAWLVFLINNKLVKFASETSYGVYLFHGFFISFAGLLISRTPILLALSPAHRVGGMLLFVLLGAYLTAYVVYRLIEQPGIKLGGRINSYIFPVNRKPIAAW